MDEKALIDVFHLCWDVISKESSTHGFKKAFFDSQHFKIIDTTDTNFDILENRLAYTYKYGCYNILFFEKCFLNFLNECSEFETVFPLKKLKVCSLSNGPGFDIIGLLCALYKSNKPLSSFPILNTVNMYHSWLSLYEMLIHKAYEIINLKITKFIPIKKENVNLIQGDIFSTLSPEVKQCISNSNVLLMVKVFFSSKATVNKFARSLQKIFLLLKPGTLIFFIGSENNMNNFSRRSFLSHYVKTIYGPQKVTLDNIVIPEIFSNATSQKPVSSGHAEFVVWQKRKASDIKALREDSEKNKKKNKTKKIKKMSLPSNENTLELGIAIVSEGNIDSNTNYNSDSESELSYTSGSKLSDTSSIPIFLSQSDSIHSSESVIPIFDKFNLEYINYCENEHKIDDFQQKHFQLCSDNASDLTNNTSKEFYTDSLDNSMSTITDTKSSTSAYYLGCFDLMENKSLQDVKNTPQESSLNLKFAGSTSIDTGFPSNVQQMCDENDNESFCFRESGMQFMNKATSQHSEMNNKSDPEITFQKNVSLAEQSDSLGNGMSMVTDIKSSTSANYEGCCDLMENKSPEVVKNISQESDLNLKYIVSTSTDVRFPSNIQHMSDENANESSCITEGDMQSINKTTGLHTEITFQKNASLFEQCNSLDNGLSTINKQHSEIDHKRDPEIIFQKNASLPKQSSENLMQQRETIVETLEANVQASRENTRDMNLHSLHSLVQQCENLVTALEKLTISMKSDIDSSKNYSNCNKLYSGYHCCCCVKIIHVCCCHKTYNS